MGRNRNLGNSNANSGNSEEVQNLVNNVKDFRNEDERNFEEDSLGTEREVTKNYKKQHLLNAVQITSKKYESEQEKQDEVKEVRRSRGRPRKNLVETEIRKNLKKSYCENDDDLLKFENEVYDNEETFNANMENSPSTDINLLSIDMSDSSEPVKPVNSVSPNFEAEVKISTESIITISSEENSNSNPILRALQSTPTSDRNLSSPDVLKVQFNPSSTKTYKNKRKFVNSLIDNNCIDNNLSIEQNITEETAPKSVQNEKIKSSITKSSANFEINPNFVRNTRKKVLKYDVCDLLNKKSHKKIQIEARIDSMPVKSKVNAVKTSESNIIVQSNKNEISPTRVIPKINNLPSIIRKNATHDIEYPNHDNSSNIFSSVIDSSPPPKSLIQIQGKIVADNRLICLNKESSQVDSLKESKFFEMEPKLLNQTYENNLLIRDTPVKRKPGRPKIKKDNVLPSSETNFSSNFQTIESNSEVMQKIDKCKTENTVLVYGNPDNLIQISGSTNCSQIKNLETTTKKILSKQESIEPKQCEVSLKTPVPYVAVTSKISDDCDNVSFTNEISEQNKAQFVKTSFTESVSLRENKNNIEGSNATLISTQMNSNVEKINCNESFNSNEKYKSNLVSNPIETQVLSIKNIKDVRVLIKGLDNIKLKKQERCDSFEKLGCSEKVVEEEVEVNLKDNKDSTYSPEKLFLKESVIDIKKSEQKITDEIKLPDEIKAIEDNDKSEKEKNSLDLAKKSEKNVDENKFSDIKNFESKDVQDKIENTKPLFVIKTNDNLSERNIDSVNILQETIIDKNATDVELEACEKILNFETYEPSTKSNNLDIDIKLNRKNITEETNTTNSTEQEELLHENIDQLLNSIHEEINLPDKNKDVSFPLLETSHINEAPQQIKPKELKTGMDIWLEKVQLETKLKNLQDSTKKLKTEMSLKTKSKEEFKIKNDGKRKSDINPKLEPQKNDNKNKQYPISKDDLKYLNSSKPRKDYKEKLENKSKLIVSKYDAKNKEIKPEKKLKEEVKVKSDAKTETKVKTEIIISKQNFKADKEECKLKNDKSNKLDVGNLMGKNETSLKTIDIFNFAAKDEIVQKGYSKKKTKKNDLNPSYQEKNQFTKSDVVDIKNDVDIDSNLKKTNTLEKSPKISKKLDKIFFEKNEDLDKNLENETGSTEIFIEDNTKFRKRSRDFEEEINRSLCIDSNLISGCENEPAHSIEKIPESINIIKVPKEIPIVDNLEISDAQQNSPVQEENSNKLLKNESLDSKLSNEVFRDFPGAASNSFHEEKDKVTIIDALVTKETDVEDNKKTTLKAELPEANDSTNEVLDPLKDIESFLEAAGNLLSRSHSSDDEKDPLGRRGIRNRNSAQSDDKISFEPFEEENDLSTIKKDENLTLEHNVKSQSQDVKENIVIEKECIDKIQLKTISNMIHLEKIKKPELSSGIDLTISTKLMQRENREEWFNQIDSSIDKDLNDEVSFEKIRKLNESIPLPKKTGTGPRTPPLPPPLSDEEIEKSKINDNLIGTTNMFERDNLEKDIANSIISTSIKIPISMATSLHELKFMGSPKNQNDILDEQLKLIENQMNKKSKKKSEASQKDKELKKFLKTLKKNELSGDWKKTYKELKKIKKKSAEGFAVSKSSLKYLPENENLSSNEETLILNVNQKNKKNSDLQDEYNNSNLTIRRSHRLKSIALQQQSQQMAIGRGGLVRNDYEDLIRADLSQVQEQNTKFLKAMENSLNQFKQIKENEYKCERVVSKEARRMVCDCFLTREEEDRGEYGCGEDCLNRLLMIECGPKCNVGDRCTNKRFQRGQYAPCRVFMTEKKGCGIFAEVEIPAGEFIMEYVGEVVDSDQFEKRAAEYSACKNKHFYFMSLRSNAIIDATARGNISRFINHSCDPNAETQKWTVNGELHIGFFTTRAIGLGEEITFDYQFQRYGKQAQKCFCEATNCRGWIGEEPDSDEEIEDDIELSFKDKEELEKISRDTQSYPGSEKMKKLDENMDDMQKLSRKEISLDIDKNKSVLSDEELKIKQQEREQRKKDKLRKREIRLAQQKHDFLEDPDLEDEIYRLSKSGLKNQVQTLRLSRLIVRSKLLQTRLNLLEILRAGEIPCRRLFLDYHGLKLLHGWMNESESKDSTPTDDNLKMRLAILETLNCLPIPNKTMLKESKVYQIVHNWSQDKVITTSPTDDFASDSNSGHAGTVKEKPVDTILDSTAKEILTDIKKLAIKLINDWEVLPEVFRIPRKERVEQMKEHEREADRRCAGVHVVEDGRDSKTTRDRYKKSRWDNCTKQRWTKSDNIKDRRKVDQEKLDDGLTKEQRRQAFAAKVAQDEAEKLNAEKRRNLEFEARREFEFKCKFFLLDCAKTHPRDIPFCVDQKTNTWYTLDKRKIPTPPSHMHIKMPPKTKSTNVADYQMPQIDLPPGWKFAIEPTNGRIYYYHVKIRRSQWEPPPRIYPLATPENNVNNISSTSNVTASTNDNNSSDSSESDNESIDESDATSLLVQERAISPRKEEDRVYNQHEMRRYKENKEKIRRRKEEIKRRKARILLKSGELSSDDLSAISLNETGQLPIADYLISSEEDDDVIVEELDSKLIERIVKGESIVDELDALKIKKPLKRPLPIKDKQSGNGSSIVSEFKKRSKLDDKKQRIHEEFKKLKSTNKNSKYFVRRAKEKFRSDIAGIIVHHLQPYRKESCHVGKITTNEDFKHLARKLTHFVMIKELKHCDLTGQTLIVTDSVKNKSREFIKKYMAKYGKIYVRPETDPEYKEIPL